MPTRNKANVMKKTQAKATGDPIRTAGVSPEVAKLRYDIVDVAGLAQGNVLFLGEAEHRNDGHSGRARRRGRCGGRGGDLSRNRHLARQLLDVVHQIGLPE